MSSETRTPLLMLSESTAGERTPLLAKTKSAQQDGSKVDPDVIDQLENLPTLLVRTMAVFTLALVLSILAGAVRLLVSFAIPKVVCMAPTIMAEIWLVYQLTRAVRWLRRAMVEEERKRRQTLRRLARRRRLARARTPSAELPTSALLRDASVDASAQEMNRAGISVTVSRAVTTTVAAAKASQADIASVGSPPPAPPLSPDQSVKSVPSPESSKKDTAEPESKVDHPMQSAPGKGVAAEETEEAQGGPLDEVEDADEASETTEDWAEVATDPLSAAVKPVPLTLPHNLRERLVQLSRWSDHDRIAAISARTVRISYLLQLWVRLWLTMTAFAIASDVFLTLLLLRLLGVSSADLPSSVVACPVIVALSVLAVHSIIMLDGGGGTGGGAALRGGGSRSWLGLGRRPIIILCLISSALICFKTDATEKLMDGKPLTDLEKVVDKISWPIVLSPLWIAMALVEAVFLRALWENRTGQNCVSSISWFFGATVECLGCGKYLVVGSSQRRQRRARRQQVGQARHQASFRDQRSAVSFFSSIRRRASLTNSQRAAAGAICGGILFIVVAMVGCSVRQDNHRNAVWAVPSTLFSAAIGQALIGAGIWRLTLSFSNRVREGIPPATKPLPVLYSEREGGWIVGPADPPTVTVFLLGEVVLRQEGLDGNCRGGNACYDMDSQHYYTSC